MKTIFQEDQNLLRTEENYEADCRLKNPSETGVVELCCFSEWDNYSAINNSVLDLIHDEFEGRASYLLTNVCNDLIHKQQIFDLDYLNARIETFNENTTPLSNKVPVIKKAHITGNNKLKMSSAEMINFTRSFGLIVGEKMRHFEGENETWELYTIYRGIIDILLSPRNVERHYMKLEMLIPEFLSLYIKLFGHLKYKFHLLIHVLRILRKYGPLIHYWAMRMESKQRELKAVATCSSNTQNILKTISLRSQLKPAHFKATGSLQIPDIEVNAYDYIDPRLRQAYFSDVPAHIVISSTNNVVFRGTTFELGMMCVIEMGDYDLLVFGLIEDIFIVQQEVFTLFQPHTNYYFDKTVYFYLVIARQSHVVKNVKNLPDIHPCIFTKIDEYLYVTPKYVL
ncbi:hypothetical protein QAD02_006497 [Eretmocerus hayati]|uniref:Uncharacterized protein n=1 Tax=Eretmocerus hayati TaxID=131215 RepID=A0ACC2N121_9HYME|nr:hypothetical protein QAD02_006497 [Eretmocerus hayati]